MVQMWPNTTRIDDLRATFEAAVRAFNARELELWLAITHDHLVGANPFSPFFVAGTTAFQQFIETACAYDEHFNIVSTNPHDRVIGTTGAIWSHTTLTLKPKDGPLTLVYALDRHLCLVRWLMVPGEFPPSTTRSPPAPSQRSSASRPRR
jgi:hypothetical protein